MRHVLLIKSKDALRGSSTEVLHVAVHATCWQDFEVALSTLEEAGLWILGAMPLSETNGNLRLAEQTQLMREWQADRFGWG